MYLKISFILLISIVVSCQPIEKLTPLEIDISKLEKISINAKDIKLNNKYKSVFSQNNIEDQSQKLPIDVLIEWNKNNILNYGNENNLTINILDASITRMEVENVDAKKYEEKTIYKYELFFLAEYQIYDGSGFLRANTTVETSRSTTSQKYISLNETEIIINNLISLSLKDYINETKKQLSIYMNDYLGD